MKNRKSFVTADPHFGHEGVCRFLRRDGATKLRPWSTAAEMDEALVERWNETVGEFDRVYVLGDVAINKKGLPILSRLNGKLVLIGGNHDIFGAQEYLKYFEDVRSYKVVEGGAAGPRAILSHIPIHTGSIGRFTVNIHGHLHANEVPEMARLTGVDGSTTEVQLEAVDPRYVCVSMEHTDFRPVELEEVIVKAHARLQQGLTPDIVVGND